MHSVAQEIHDLLAERRTEGVTKTQIDRILSENGIKTGKGLILGQAQARQHGDKYYLGKYLPKTASLSSSVAPDAQMPGFLTVTSASFETTDGASVTIEFEKPRRITLPKIN